MGILKKNPIEIEWIDKVKTAVNLEMTAKEDLIILSWKVALMWNTIFTTFIAAPNMK